ncbi:DUF4287 domain-containing protein [Nocardioides sp.]|uniref:DUF4287 domain-containing protein n=1 Tax=Nocardioides sp. TaxID=35761 RepID=UPI0025EACE72|nr:DUF4287 domain-containing protein [Nocardioides sp.]
MSEKVKGPASYFPSIEKTYGQPIEHWKQVVRAAPGYGSTAKPPTHMDLVALLKEEGLGHGHANAVVAHTLAEDR